MINLDGFTEAFVFITKYSETLFIDLDPLFSETLYRFDLEENVWFTI